MFTHFPTKLIRVILHGKTESEHVFKDKPTKLSSYQSSCHRFKLGQRKSHTARIDKRKHMRYQASGTYPFGVGSELTSRLHLRSFNMSDHFPLTSPSRPMSHYCIYTPSPFGKGSAVYLTENLMVSIQALAKQSEQPVEAPNER
jgi:hypothetical protein